MQVKIVNGDVDVLASTLNQAITDAYEKGQQTERERIKEIIKAIGVQGEHDQWFDACDKIMEAIDAPTE